MNKDDPMEQEHPNILIAHVPHASRLNRPCCTYVSCTRLCDLRCLGSAFLSSALTSDQGRPAKHDSVVIREQRKNMCNVLEFSIQRYIASISRHGVCTASARGLPTATWGQLGFRDSTWKLDRSPGERRTCWDNLVQYVSDAYP